MAISRVGYRRLIFRKLLVYGSQKLYLTKINTSAKEIFLYYVIFPVLPQLLYTYNMRGS